MSYAIKHECGIALIRLKQPLQYYLDKYGTAFYGINKLHLLMDTEVTFILTNGGHNAGVVSEPGHPGRGYRVATRLPEGHYIDPDVWAANTPRKDGSWWPEWVQWLSIHSGEPAAPPSMGTTDSRFGAVCDAPGTYVLMR